MNHPLSPLLQAFYTQSLTAEERTQIHQTLLSSLTDPAYHKSATAYITHIATAPKPGPIDPFLLHHSLHTIETLARSAFSSIPKSDLNALQQLLLDLLTTANLRHLNQDSPSQDRVPPHALNKAAAALVALSKRQWLSNPSATDTFFPEALFRLVDSPAHTPRSLASMLAGHALLTTLLDDALSVRRDLRAEDTAKLKRLIASYAPRLLSALEVAQRAAGPNVPQHVAPAAARAVASLCRLCPSVSSDACAVLARSAHGRFDSVAVNILSAAIEILTMRVNVSLGPITHTTIAALEALVGGTRSRKDEARIAPTLLSLVDEVVQRLVSSWDPLTGKQNQGLNLNERNGKQDFEQTLEQVLNAFMGVTVRWASERPSWFPQALESWTNVIDAFMDADLLDCPLLIDRILPSVATLCMQRAFFASNEPVLKTLRQPNAAFFDNSQSNEEPQDLKRWEELSAIVSSVADEPFGPSCYALFLDRPDGDVEYGNEDDDDDDDGDGGHGNDFQNGGNGNDDDDNPAGWESVSVLKYTSRCIELLSLLGSMSSVVVLRASEAARTILLQASDKSPGALVDVYNALLIAQNISKDIPGPDSQTLMKTILALTVSGAWRVGRVGIMALRALAFHSVNLTTSDSEHPDALVVLTELVKLGRDVLAASPPGHVTTTAAWLIIGIDRYARQPLFKDTLPLGLDIIVPACNGASSPKLERPGLALLGTASLVRWLLVPPRGATGMRARWREPEWVAREAKFGEVSKTLFAPLALTRELCASLLSLDGVALRVVARQSAMVKTVISTLEFTLGRGTNAVWKVCVREAIFCFITILNSLAQQIPTADVAAIDKMKYEITVTVSSILSTILESARICGRCAGPEIHASSRDAIRAVVGFTSHPSLAGIGRSMMRLMCDCIASGDVEMLETGIDIAVTCLHNTDYSNPQKHSDSKWNHMFLDDDVNEVSVSLLCESIKRHWRIMWPEDTVPSDKQQTLQNSDAGKAIFFKSLGGIVQALKSRQLNVCRAALLALQQLDASRRLYSRPEAFQRAGAGLTIISECLRILGAGGDSGRESLADEAVEVLWGVAKADRATFSRSLPDIVREVSGGTIDDTCVQQVAALFNGVDDHPSFSRTVLAAANDMVFYGSLRPSL